MVLKVADEMILGVHLTEQDVRSIAKYARIGLAEDEIPRMTSDLNAIIDSLGVLTEFDLGGVEPTYHPIDGLVNVMRDDVLGESFSQAVALANAPKQQDGCFVVPSILGTAAGSGVDEGGE